MAVYGSSPEQHVVYATTFLDVGNWIFSGATAGVTTCGTSGVLGGYGVLDFTDSVSLTLSNMIPHSTMTVEFDFVKVRECARACPHVYVCACGWLAFSEQHGCWCRTTIPKPGVCAPRLASKN